jgi:hypothetical protein
MDHSTSPDAAPEADLDKSIPEAIEQKFEVRDLTDLLPPKIAGLIDQLPKAFIDLTEQTYEKETDYKPTQVDEQLRYAFWQEYERILERRQRRMVMANVYSRIVHNRTFYDIIENPRRLAYFIIPPIRYSIRMEQNLSLAMERVREILELPITRQICRCEINCRCPGANKRTPNQKKRCRCRIKCKCSAKIDAKLAQVILNAAQMVDLRVKGAGVKKIDQRILQANINVGDPNAPNKTQPELNNLADLDRQIAELERESKAQALPPGRVYCVTPLEQQPAPALETVTVIHEYTDEAGQARTVTSESRITEEN